MRTSTPYMTRYGSLFVGLEWDPQSGNLADQETTYRGKQQASKEVDKDPRPGIVDHQPREGCDHTQRDYQTTEETVALAATYDQGGQNRRAATDGHVEPASWESSEE